MSLLSALAGVTRTIKLGTMVLVLPLRNPAYFAKEWATLDLLSGGRSILGVGVGWHEEEFALMGIPHKERGRRMDEMLELVTALWAGDNVTYTGKYYQVKNLTIDPKPAQKPHPPIWIGGGSQPFEKVYGQTVTNIDPGAQAHREVRQDLGAAFLGHRRHGHGRLEQDPALHG